MEKGVDWFAEKSWPTRNNNFEEKNESNEGQVTFACSKDEDTPDWFAEHSWPASTKYFERKEEEDDRKEGQVTLGCSQDEEETPPGWCAEHSWPASTKCEKEEEKKSSASEESWLRETGWPDRHDKLKLYQQGELVEDQKGRRQQSCCSIL